MELHQVAMMHRVPLPGQPQRVAPRPAAHVGDHRRRRRERPLQDLAGAGVLHLAERRVEPVALLPAHVVPLELLVR